MLVAGRLLGITSRGPVVSKSKQWHFVIFQVFLLIEGCFIDSSEMRGNFSEVLNFNWLILKLNWFICN